MPSYFKVMLGQGHKYAADCLDGGFIGAHHGIDEDLAGKLPDQWVKFNEAFIPVWMASHPGRSKIAAGLACGSLWTIARGIQKGDVVLSPDGTGYFHVGEVTGDYYYVADAPLPHRRGVHWSDQLIAKSAMSEPLRNSLGAIGTVSNMTAHAAELALLASGGVKSPIVATDAAIEDPATFALEKHLEDFLVANWKQTELGKQYAIFAEDGEIVGQQYLTDTGPIDILARSDDLKELLVVELKRGRASDVVVGQVLRYMGFVKDELAESGQAVRGAIVALEDDPKLRRALSAVPNVDFYRYTVSFKLTKS